MRTVLLLKASIPADARWITIHPGGAADGKGQPVLIQPQADGSAKVIGGAGGSLNHLRLRGVKSEAEFKAEAHEKRKAAVTAKKEQRKRDKEAGIVESKKAAREAVKSQQRKAQHEFISTVGKAMGWAPESLQFDASAHPNLSDAAVKKLADQHHQATLEQANKAVEMVRQRLVNDADARQEAGIGEIPLDAPPEALSVDDIAPVPPSSGGLGFSPDYKGRAEKAGATKEAIKDEATAAKPEKTPEQRQAAIKRGDTAKAVTAELKDIREPILPVKHDLADARVAVDLLKARKKMLAVQKQASAAKKEIDKAVSAPEPKAFILEAADGVDDAAIKRDIENDLRTASTTAFLSEYKRLAGESPEETLGKHIGVGAYNSINSLALAVGGDALVDRSVVDVLGIAGAAQVLARRLHTDMAEDMAAVTEGMQDFHLHHYMATSEQALSDARDLVESAKAIELPDAETGTDLATAQELNAKRRRAVVDAQKILGQAYGEMEANAALVVALKQGAKNEVQTSLGKMSAESAIQRARALGLQKGDYSVETGNGNTFLTVNAAGMDRLAKPVSRADVTQVKRNLAIINGDEDEQGWLPQGIAKRPDLGLSVKAGVAPQLAKPFDATGDLHQGLSDYIGGRTADGDTPADIMADIQSQSFFDQVGPAKAAEYRAALDKLAPLKGEDGSMRRAETLDEPFNQLADSFVQKRYGGERSPLNRQKVPIDDTTTEALHRALTEHPDGVVAYKQLGDLSNADQRALRETFYRDIAHESPEAADLRRQAEEHGKAEPEVEEEDMFGERVPNPAHAEWKGKRDELSTKVNAASLDWNKYAATMGGHERAYEAIQDTIKSRVGKAFADAHNRLRPDAPVKVGRAVIRNNLSHLDATDPAAREERSRRERELTDSLRERNDGRYAAGSVSGKLNAARDEREAFEQSQMGFFSSQEAAPDTPSVLKGDERHTLGHEVERQVAAMMGQVGQNFKPGKPTKLFNPEMSTGKNAARQRLVRLVDANKRVTAAFGTGSGKTLLQMASFTHLHEQGKAKRGCFLVPSIVQGQFGGEALRFIDPKGNGGKGFNWHCQPGASRAERIAAYKNADHHFVVMTHQSFRDDMLHLSATHAGISEQEMTAKLGAMTRTERKGWMRELMDREGINFDYSTVDESQNISNRAGKDNSGQANVIDALGDNTPYLLHATADPVKSDASEAFDMMSKMDPERYSDRSAFMRRYGADTLASKAALKRELVRHVYPSKIDPDVKADRKTSTVPLSNGQKAAMTALDKAMSKARISRMTGAVDVEALKTISPGSFEGVPADQHQAVAANLSKNIGILKAAAEARIINEHPDNAKIDDIVKHAHERRGKPGVVFARSLKSVQMIKDRLEAAGHRVVMLTGADTGQEKEKKRLAFNPESGDAAADIMVASDAGSTGMNIQRGQWLYQLDTPMTAMVHGQRAGRIYRTGQKNNVELIDAVADHPSERIARQRLARKQGLRELMSSPMEGMDDTGLGFHIAQAKSARAQASTF